MKIGYARVSTRDQNLELQLDALTQAGCTLIYQEKASGALAARVELDKLLAQLRPGDTVYIYKLDRLGRSLKHLLDLVADLQRREVGLVSLTDAINTNSAQGRLVLNLFASLAEFERELTRERTFAGLAAARARGRVGGRKPGLSEEAQRTALAAETLYRAQQLSTDDMARSLRISKATFYKYLRHRGVPLTPHRKAEEQVAPTTI
ncbi:recombinase family protein [Hymenobacter metallicola]|uniref:Recombinase family protein n=1 Tax=Hymenobacter metallicola TaxID=2563114 RepID=A0A4Z0PVL9_9BACT|nr:recombinase family protein [Hymenobacter metallicola]TGE21021.1 recombinase family protein [Hymenobacter metallicola]